MTVQNAYLQLSDRLCSIYQPREAANIANLAIEYVTGLSKLDRIINKSLSITPIQEKTYEDVCNRLLQHEPVQYITGNAWFMQMSLNVNKHVLIPRPETEELADKVIKEIKAFNKNEIKVLDIGTGSGCIPISIKKNVPGAAVTAIDISKFALEVAKDNAEKQQTEIKFSEMDILDQHQWLQLDKYDWIVSNPPYISQCEQQSMSNNVLLYEPHSALFVPDKDALQFYKAIAKLGRKHLKTSGRLFVEINEMMANEVKQLFVEFNYSAVQVIKDMQEKDRIITASF